MYLYEALKLITVIGTQSGMVVVMYWAEKNREILFNR